MSRIPFSNIFRVNTDGTISPLQTIRIAGTTMAAGTIIPANAAFGGVVLSQYAGHDLEVVPDNNVSVITGIYSNVEQKQR